MRVLKQELLTLVRHRQLAWQMALRDMEARHSGTAVGALWAYAQPLLTVAMYYLMFDVVFAMRLGDAAPVRQVGLFLIVGMLPWMAFCDALGKSMGSLVEAADLLRKNPLPMGLFPVRSVLSSMMVFAPLLLATFVLYTPLHQWRAGVWAWPLLVLSQILLCMLMGYVLAILVAALRDVLPVVGFMLSLGIFLSPALFPMTQFPAAWRWVLWLNPMTPWVLGQQAVMLQGQWPPASVWWAVAIWLAVLAAMLGVLLKQSRDQLVDWL